MSAEQLIGLATIISAVGQIFEARWGSGRAQRRMVSHLVDRVERIDTHLGLPPIPTNTPIGFRSEGEN